MRSGKDRPFVGLERCAVRIVLDVFDIRSPLVEAVLHIVLRELRESARLEAKVFHDLVDALDLARSDGLEHVIRERGAPVWRRYGGQGENLEVCWSKATDHVPRVQTSHAVRDDVDLLALRLLCYAFSKFRRSRLDAAAWWDGRHDNFNAIV